MRATDRAEAQHLSLWHLGSDIVAHTALGQEEVARRIDIPDIIDHRRGAPGEVSCLDDLWSALRLGEDDDVGELLPDILDILDGELIMDSTLSIPAADGIGRLLLIGSAH